MKMRRSSSAVLLAIPVAMMVLVGCSQAQDAAKGAAKDAGSKAAGAAKTEVMKQACGAVRDGEVSADDKKLVSGLLETAKGAGVEAEVLEPLKQIAESGDEVPGDALADLLKECEAVPTS